MASDWRIWVVADLVGVPDSSRVYALAYEVTGLPCVPSEGDIVALPSWRNESGRVECDTYTVRSRFFWANGRYVTLSVEHVEYDNADDMMSVGWIPECHAKMEAK